MSTMNKMTPIKTFLTILSFFFSFSVDRLTGECNSLNCIENEFYRGGKIVTRHEVVQEISGKLSYWKHVAELLDRG